MKKTIWILITVLVSQNLYAGGPWTQQKRNFYLKFSERWLVFDQHFTDQGLLDPNVTTGLFNTTLFAEYGISDRFTGIVNAPLFSRNYMNNLISSTTNELLVAGEALNSIGDIDLSVKYAISKRYPFAVTIGVGIPTGVPSGGSQGNLQTGDGEFNQMVQLDFGQGFSVANGVNAYFSTYAGVNNRTNGFSDEFRYGVELGASVLQNRLWLIGRIGGIESFQNGDTAATAMSTSIFSNNSEFTSYGVEAAYYVSRRVGFSASFTSAFRGRIIAAAPSYSVGVFYDMSK